MRYVKKAPKGALMKLAGTYIALSPYLLFSFTLSVHINTNKIIAPTSGTKDINHHQPDLLMSCILLIKTAMPGIKTTSE